MARTQVQSELIATNAISGTIIADGAITSTHLAANCVDSSELVTGSIDTIHIAANQVTSAKIVSDAVLTRHIADNQVTGDQLANGISMTNATTIVTDGAASTLTLHRDGSNIGTASTIGTLHFAQDYDASLQNWGAISLKTTSSAVRARLAFDVKSTSGNVMEGMTVFGTDSNGPMVGIGTTSPAKPLHISSADNQPLRVESTDAYSGIEIKDNGSATLPPLISALSNDFIFYGGHASTRPEIFRATTDGDVGIGMTPITNSRLTVKTQGNGTYPIRVVNSADSDMLFGVYESSTGDGNNAMVYMNDGAGNTDVKLSTNGVSWFNGGHVGMGTTSPDRHLHLVGAGANDGRIKLENTDNNYYGGLVMTSASNEWHIGVGGSSTNAGYASSLYFHENSDGLRMTLNDSGVLIIGDTTTHSGGHDAVSRLQLTGGGSVLAIKQSQVNDASHRVVTVFTDSGGTYRGRITINNSACSFTSASDYRLKENIETLPNGLDRLKQLKPVKFKWKEHDYTSEGFIAHEVQEVYPDAIVGEKDDEAMQSMDYGKITPLLVKAIQEQQTIIDDLKSRIKTLEG